MHLKNENMLIYEDNSGHTRVTTVNVTKGKPNEDDNNAHRNMSHSIK
jgi:hypothetical protein